MCDVSVSYFPLSWAHDYLFPWALRLALCPVIREGQDLFKQTSGEAGCVLGRLTAPGRWF